MTEKTAADTPTTVVGTSPDQSLDLPTVPEEVTASWLSGVLGTKIKSIKLEKVVPGTATKLFVTVEYDETDKATLRPTHLCIKGGFNPALVEQMPWIVSIYQREVEFFNRIAPTLDHMEIPKSWWAGHNSKQGIVIMDDLAAQGCTFGTVTEAWPVSDVRHALDDLAALHAKTWGVTKEELPWLTSDYDTALLSLMETYEAVVNGPERPVIPDFLKDQKRITAVLKKHYASRNPRFTALTHADGHISNTYRRDGKPHFLDWQMIHISSVFHDVAYFICGALSTEDRRQNELSLVDHYLVTLKRLGGPSFSRDDKDVMEEYRKNILIGVGWLLCPETMQPLKNIVPMALRFAAALEDHKVLELVESLP
ncbi:kinase-like domain-containing protein [Hypoxylon trugodes]|uniref:kinase-like domain-containing protein n=1 Tax=Hypoxylon trugodes TaxID=326681 RepID=UPI00219CE95E|nr:kinase-like domain-containing protein [Hypoxylon trugodes]KAI1390396.1 kinase-like domain-containing protein [Hypoxylon trugodes]